MYPNKAIKERGANNMSHPNDDDRHHKHTFCCSEDSDDIQQILEQFTQRQVYQKIQNEPDIADNRRDYRLFRQWADKASGAISVYCRYSTPCLENFDPQEHAFLVLVDFDYNQKNFRPVCMAPDIVTLDRSTKSAVYSQNELQSVMMGMIKYKDLMLTVPVFFDRTIAMESMDDNLQPITQYGEGQLRHKMFNDISLESSVFKKWERLERENRHKSYNHWLWNNNFIQFLAHALHLPCVNPPYRPETTIVTLLVTFGFNLGQIETLDSFFVLPRMETLRNLQKWYNLTSRAAKRLEKQCTIQKQDDQCVGVSIIMLAHASRKMFVQHVVIPVSAISRNHPSPCQCDHKAMSFFRELEKTAPIELESPNLNEL